MKTENSGDGITARGTGSRLLHVPVLLIAAVALAWALILWVMPPGLYMIDELAQAAGMVTFDANGGFLIENGTAQFDSPDLRLYVLVEGPNGLVMQYPSGFTVIAAPFWALGGIKGVMVLNLLSAVGILWLTWKLAAAWEDRAIAPLAVALLAGASFLVDYATGFWPHALSVFLSLGVVYCVARVHEAEVAGRATWAWALAGGLAAGLALNVRIDTIFVLPPLVLWLLWFGHKPLIHLGLAVLGMLPGLVASAAVNFHKFGTWIPVSYGRSGGDSGMTPERYMPLAILILALFPSIMALRRLSPRMRGLVVILVMGTGIGAAAVFVPDAGQRLARFAAGFYSLIVDMATHREVGVRPGVVDTGGGTAVFWGTIKQALAQSMPWLLVLPLAALGPRPRAGTWPLFVAVMGLAALPFIFQHWHGGLSNSQRYLMVLLPLLSIAGAVALRGLAARSALSLAQALGLVAVVAAIVFLALVGSGPAAQLLLAQPLATWLFLGGLAITVLASILRTPLLFRLSWVPVIIGLALSTVFAYGLHLPASTKARTHNHEGEAVFAKVPPRTIIHSVPVNGAYRYFADTDVLVARASARRKHDMDFIRAALEDGWNIVTKDEPLVQAASSGDFGATIAPFAEDARGRQYWLLRASP